VNLTGVEAAMTKESRPDIEPKVVPAASEPIDIQVRFAIANKRLVQFGYHGTLRVAEPHDYGRLNHTTKLLIYQVSTLGAMPKKDAKGWRLLEVSEITQFAVLEAMFAGSRGKMYKRHLPWEIVYARVN
jgi:hypothetical protein